MEPTKKAPAIDKLLTAVTGVDRQQTIREENCVGCIKPNMIFRNAISRKEYTISGLCQNCQDSIFGKD